MIKPYNYELFGCCQGCLLGVGCVCLQSGFVDSFLLNSSEINVGRGPPAEPSAVSGGKWSTTRQFDSCRQHLVTGLKADLVESKSQKKEQLLAPKMKYRTENLVNGCWGRIILF